MGRENRTGVFDSKQEMELDELFRAEERKIALKIRTSVACQVVATTAQPLGFDPATQKVSLELAPRPVIINKEQADQDIVQPPIILQNIPVAFPRTSQGYITFPIAVGDTGELIIQDRSIAKWMGTGVAQDPGFRWTHNPQDGVFHPGLHPDTSPITPPVDLTATVVDGTLIKIGRNATSFALKAELLDALDAFANAVPVPNDGGAAIQTAFKAVYLALAPILATTKTQIE